MRKHNQWRLWNLCDNYCRFRWRFSCVFVHYHVLLRRRFQSKTFYWFFIINALFGFFETRRAEKYIFWMTISECVCFYQGTVYMYYGLSNFYQNHRRYVKSRNDEQLAGDSTSYGTLQDSDCNPYAVDTNNDTYIAPCGAIANSLFNGIHHALPTFSG